MQKDYETNIEMDSDIQNGSEELETLQLGVFQELMVVKTVDFGVYLAPSLSSTAPRVLLPKNEINKPLSLHEKVDAFIYKDSEDRPVATLVEPLISLHEVQRLKVKEVSKIGAFLEWGLPKDLLLPFHEQMYKVEEGTAVLVALYIDKSDRLCATMHVYDYLQRESPYQMNDEVSGRVYEISENFGVFVAVDDKYSALIPKKDVFESYKINQPVYARVVQVLDDGRLTLATKKKIPEQMSIDAVAIQNRLNNSGGFLPLNDKSSPDEIKATLHMSKAAFKRAIGNLYKNQIITIESDGIHLK